MCIEALLLVQAGASPSAIISKLEGFLTEEDIKKLESSEGK